MPASLVIQTSFLGDAILTTPLVAELALRGPVTLVVTKGAAPLFAQHPGVSRLVVYDKRGVDAGVTGFTRMARDLRAPDGEAVAYLAQGSHRSGALARAAGYKQRIGFATSAGRMWYTQAIEVLPGTHHAERLWRLAGVPDVPDMQRVRPRLYPGVADEAQVDALLRAHDATDDVLVALAPGSIWATKRWRYYPDLARELSDVGRIAVVGGPGDAAYAREITEAVGDRVIDATGKLSLLGSAALIQRARVLVTNDSAPLHLASAMNTPTVAIFGPTVTSFGFGPLANRRAVTEIEGLSCRPCSSHGPMTCPLGHFKCMLDLTAGRVLDAVQRVVEVRS